MSPDVNSELRSVVRMPFIHGARLERVREQERVVTNEALAAWRTLRCAVPRKK
jgi:hypothetical protein